MSPLERIKARLGDPGDHYREDVPWLLEQIEAARQARNEEHARQVERLEARIKELRITAREAPGGSLYEVTCGRCGRSDSVGGDGDGWQRSPKPEATLCPACLVEP